MYRFIGWILNIIRNLKKERGQRKKRKLRKKTYKNSCYFIFLFFCIMNIIYFLWLYIELLLNNFLWHILIILCLGLLTSLGLFLINRKQWNKMAMFFSWIPLLKLYSYTKIAGVSFFRYIIMPVITLFILLFIIDYLWSYQDLSRASEWLTPFLYLVWIWYMMSMWIILIYKISKKTWNWILIAIWLYIFPFIFFPIVWFLFQKDKKVF